jgi:outer membrane biogenesis lipoprotein LolB
MKKQSLVLLLGSAGLLLSSCAVTHLKPGAEKIVVTDKSHIASSCKDLGNVTAYDTNGSSVTYTSHERLQQYQVGILKNKTLALNGNVLVITGHQTTYTEDNDVDTHLLTGRAYSCSATTLQTIVPVAPSDIIHPDE